jgi:hypothetical protein
MTEFLRSVVSDWLVLGIACAGAFLIGLSHGRARHRQEMAERRELWLEERRRRRKP